MSRARSPIPLLLAFSLVALGGSASAACTTASPGVGDGDFLGACALEQGAFESPDQSYDYSVPLLVNYFTYDDGELTAVHASLMQLEGQSCYSTPCSTYGFNFGSASFYHADGTTGTTSAWLFLGQAHTEDGGFDGTSSALTGGVEAGGQYQTVTYSQVAYGPCSESLYLHSSSGSQEVVAPQPCTVQVPIVAFLELPAL